MHLQRPLLFSALIHLLMFVFFSLWQSFVLPRQRHFEVTWVELPKGMSEEIGVGIKESPQLPQSTIQEQKIKPSPPPPTPKMIHKQQQKKAPTQKMVEKKKPLSETDRKIQAALGNIDKTLAERATPEAAQIKENQEGYKYGTGNEALRVPPDDPEYLKYQSEVRTKIINEWILPFRYIEEALERNTKIEVFIDDAGTITSTTWISRSGDETFDASALRALERASPLPKPPERLSWETYHEGFLIEFDPRLKQ